MNLDDYWGPVSVPLVVAIVAFVRAVWPALPDRLAPIVALLAGLALHLTVRPDDLRASALMGLTVALAASGLYTWGKNALGK